jgi:hypothetical protein
MWRPQAIILTNPLPTRIVQLAGALSPEGRLRFFVRAAQEDVLVSFELLVSLLYFGIGAAYLLHMLGVL